MDIVVKNAFLNSFVDYYNYHYFNGYRMGYLFAEKKSIRRINTHMKLSGRNWHDEMLKFISVFEEENKNLDFILDHYNHWEVEEFWNFK